jgi:hypothetical protein
LTAAGRIINERNKTTLFVSLCCIGFVSSIFGYQLLNEFAFNFGKNLAGVLVAPILTVFYIIYCSLFDAESSVLRLRKVLLLFIVQIVPFIPLFGQEYQPTAESDYLRYVFYARKMLEHETLWGSDQLFFSDAGKHLVTQPGYRYFLLVELLLFGKFIRAIQFLEILLYLISVYFFTLAIHKSIKKGPTKKIILLVILLITPAAIKNLLLGLSEWLVLIFMMWACYFHLVTQNHIISIFILGLIPFIRQNLLFGTVLVYAPLLNQSTKKWLTLIAFIVPLGLPLYHNLYYAGEWRYFVDVARIPFLTYNENEVAVNGINYSLIASNLLHYIGFDIINDQVTFSIIGFIFLPLSVYLFFLLVKAIRVPKLKILFILSTLSTSIPTLLLGSAYYPRFELVNVMFMLTTFLLISNSAFGRNSERSTQEA